MRRVRLVESMRESEEGDHFGYLVTDRGIILKWVLGCGSE
jgi:hypothetical protein